MSTPKFMVDEAMLKLLKMKEVYDVLNANAEIMKVRFIFEIIFWIRHLIERVLQTAKIVGDHSFLTFY